MDEFLRACGCTAPLRLSLEDEGVGIARSFELPFVLAGRDPGVDLVLDHDSVSRRHAYLQAIGGRIFCIDLGSRTGIDWGRGPGRAGWVDGRQGLKIGPFQIRAEGSADAGTVDSYDPLTSHPPSGHSPDPLILEFDQGAVQTRWRVSRVLSLMGRAPECRFRILDRDVSRFHCSLLRTSEGVWVVNLLGRSGIELNGRRIRWARLKPGDSLQIGRFLARVRPDATAGPSDPEPGPGPLKAPGSSVMQPGLPAPRTGVDDARTHAPEAHPHAPEWLPATWVAARLEGDPAVPRAELIEPLMAHMSNQFVHMQQQMFAQFGQMQQQMFDQFQNALMMMAQTFGTLHRDQMADIRRELDHLRQLNQTLHALELQADLANRPAASLPTTAPEIGEVAREEAPARIETLLPRTSPNGSGAAPPGEGTTGSERRHESIENRTRTAGDPSSTRSRIDPPGNATGNQRATRPENLPDEKIHALLCQRIATLQQERQGRWQRLCELMLGR